MRVLDIFLPRFQSLCGWEPGGAGVEDVGIDVPYEASLVPSGGDGPFVFDLEDTPGTLPNSSS